MSAQAQRELRKAIAARNFDCAYYLHGGDEFRKELAVRELAAAAVDAATRDFNFDLLRGGEVAPEALGAALHTPPMMAERRLVIVRDVAALKKDARVVLDDYLRSPAADTVVLLLASAGDKADKGLEKKVTSIAFDVLDDKELAEWIPQHTRDVHGASISKSAIVLLLAAVGNDTSQIASELDKLASYTQGASIDETTVRDVVGVRSGETLGDFLDRVAKRDLAGALALVDHVLSLPRSGLVPILMALSVQTLALGWAQLARARGMNVHRIKTESFNLLKETGAFPFRPWGEAAECWSGNAERWDAADIDRALEAILTADRAAKDTRLSSDEQLLSSVVFSLCTPAGAVRA